ncbi:flagellar biosynthetic protein FliR [Anaerobacillus isosaccharinicus]|uniref:Flagellar biosynthetic protein FliR n=1 Tax=Anaerobacillus isosaccharinicus TaxID=1532552 RepID=A0A1S2L6H9_9BACI|nr:flagellar biosynthetic protein FliR [Anaerobacillus isosaccharinicus]MBA5587322.1 flagellar type III secretion system protein FliR [Anaerobacillus isosaccharinicus]QOY34483.1 flagellar type III secretion system protein FliR [Anaerobacillus isosaccharinicus]
MLDLLEFVPAFLLIVTRVSAFFITLPLFSHRTIPARHKIGFAFLLSFLMFFTVDPPIIEIDGVYFLLIMKEVIVGLTVGLIAMVMMYAIQVAGGFIDIPMGFMIANVIDPQTGTQSPLTGGYLYTFALLFLFAIDAHHLLLDGIYYSYQFIPLEQIFIPFSNENILLHFVKTFTLMFFIAFQMAMPVVGCLFLVDVALGMIGRAVPQVSVFVIGFPLKIFVGFVILILTMPAFFMVTKYLVQQMVLAMRTLMQLYGGM